MDWVMKKDPRKSSLAPPKYGFFATGIGLAGAFFRTQFKWKFGSHLIPKLYRERLGETMASS